MGLQYFFRLKTPYVSNPYTPETSATFGPFHEAPRISKAIKVDGVEYGGQPTGEWWWCLDEEYGDPEHSWEEVVVWAEVSDD